jgi:hypothetical protein
VKLLAFLEISPEFIVSRDEDFSHVVTLAGHERSFPRTGASETAQAAAEVYPVLAPLPSMDPVTEVNLSSRSSGRKELENEIMEILDEYGEPILLSNLGGSLSQQARMELQQRREKLLVFLQKSRCFAVGRDEHFSYVVGRASDAPRRPFPDPLHGPVDAAPSRASVRSTVGQGCSDHFAKGAQGTFLPAGRKGTVDLGSRANYPPRDPRITSKDFDESFVEDLYQLHTQTHTQSRRGLGKDFAEPRRRLGKDFAEDPTSWKGGKDKRNSAMPRSLRGPSDYSMHRDGSPCLPRQNELARAAGYYLPDSHRLDREWTDPRFAPEDRRGFVRGPPPVHWIL